jgi:isoquinoline 1-oxidoreductase subunit alpha
MLSLTINGAKHEVDVPAEMPLLWVIRDVVGMTGTKFGCGASQCGCCTVLLDGQAVRSCVTPVSQATGKHITTVEGLHSEVLARLQTAWVAEQVPQCGYCQPGQLMSAAALLGTTAHPSDQQITDAMNGNLCRCGMYGQIRKAIKRAATETA